MKYSKPFKQCQKQTLCAFFLVLLCYGPYAIDFNICCKSPIIIQYYVSNKRDPNWKSGKKNKILHFYQIDGGKYLLGVIASKGKFKLGKWSVGNCLPQDISVREWSSKDLQYKQNCKLHIPFLHIVDHS